MADADMVVASFGPLIEDLRIRVLPTTIPVAAAQVRNESTRFWIGKAGKWWDFVKLRAWELTPYQHVAFLDGDVFFTQNMDDFFDMPECSRAAGKASPFNAGFFRVEPSIVTYRELIGIVETQGFDIVSGWDSQCAEGSPDKSHGRLCNKHRDGSMSHRVAGGESTQGMLAYFCDVVRDMKSSTMIDAGNFRDGPYGCRLEEPPGVLGRCRTVAEGVRAVHATGGCGKHPRACGCPELYDIWWQANSKNLEFLKGAYLHRNIVLHGGEKGKLGCLSPSTKGGFWTWNCPSMKPSALLPNAPLIEVRWQQQLAKFYQNQVNASHSTQFGLSDSPIVPTRKTSAANRLSRAVATAEDAVAAASSEPERALALTQLRKHQKHLAVLNAAVHAGLVSKAPPQNRTAAL